MSSSLSLLLTSWRRRHLSRFPASCAESFAWSWMQWPAPLCERRQLRLPQRLQLPLSDRWSERS